MVIAIYIFILLGTAVAAFGIGYAHAVNDNKKKLSPSELAILVEKICAQTDEIIWLRQKLQDSQQKHGL